jgi:hypothetical protein
VDVGGRKGWLEAQIGSVTSGSMTQPSGSRPSPAASGVRCYPSHSKPGDRTGKTLDTTQFCNEPLTDKKLSTEIPSTRQLSPMAVSGLSRGRSS